jgi:hypothetical protein
MTPVATTPNDSIDICVTPPPEDEIPFLWISPPSPARKRRMLYCDKQLYPSTLDLSHLLIPNFDDESVLPPSTGTNDILKTSFSSLSFRPQHGKRHMPRLVNKEEENKYSPQTPVQIEPRERKQPLTPKKLHLNLTKKSTTGSGPAICFSPPRPYKLDHACSA